jgi:hypothetical protein
MASNYPVALRNLRTSLGWILLALFVGMVALWTVFGFMPGLVDAALEPFASFGRISEFWPIFAGFVAGGGAAWALTPGLTIHGEESGESRIRLSPLVAALLGPSSLILMFAAYWPCAGNENPVWASLRHALEALEGYVAEPFGAIQGCPADFPQGLMAGILFGRTTLVLVIGWGFAYIFRHSIDAMRARFSAQVVVFAGLDNESTEAARSVRTNLTRRQRLLLLDDGPGLVRARELAREIGAIVLSIDVSDTAGVQAFMQARGRRGIQGLYLMSSDAGVNVKAIDSFLRWQTGPANSIRVRRAATEADLQAEVVERAASQQRLLKKAATSSSWRAPKKDSGLVPRARALRTEVPGRVVVRIDNPWHAEDWRQRQMIARAGWLFDAVSTNENAARHVVRQAKDENVEELIMVGSSPFELAVLSEIAFEHRVDRALTDAAALGKQRQGAGSRDHVATTPSVLLHGEESREAVEHFQRQLLRFGIKDADRHIRFEVGTAQESMNNSQTKRALILSDTPGYDPTFLAASHPRWRIFAWTPAVRGLTLEPMIGRLSMVGATLEPVPRSGVDIWERLARIMHEIYLYHWQSGIPVPGDPNRGDWDDDLDAFARESNIRSFATFCRSVAGLERQWGTDLGDGGAQSEHPLSPEEIRGIALNEHDSWVRHHVEYGWRLGDARREDGTPNRTKKKRHPDIVEWAALSPENQEKDYDSITSTVSLMKSLGFSLVDKPAGAP